MSFSDFSCSKAAFLDSSCFSKTGTGETIAEIYERNGVTAEPSPKNRIAGWNLIHEYLRISDEKSKMLFFKNCFNAIKTIPTLIHDDRHPEDLDSSGDDHCVDGINYGLQYLHEGKSSQPLSPIEQKLKEWQNKFTVNPQNLNKFYSGRLR